MDAKMAELDPQFGELLKERAEIHKKVRPPRKPKQKKERKRNPGKEK